MQEILLATRNTHKTREIQEILRDLDLKILNLDDVGQFPEVVEDGHSFEENAIKKAMTIAKASGIISMADDSGLVVDCLDGRPGVYSARFAGPEATDEENNDRLLMLMDGVEPESRQARFVCCIAVCTPEGKCEVVKGSCEGHISMQASGSGGFGYDPLFFPEHFVQSFAELSPEDKNAISHRGQALKQVRDLLLQLNKQA